MLLTFPTPPYERGSYTRKKKTQRRPLRLRGKFVEQRQVSLTPWALEQFRVGVFSAAAAIRKLAHTTLNLSFATLRNRRPTLLRAPAYRTPSEASPRRRCGHASRFLHFFYPCFACCANTRTLNLFLFTRYTGRTRRKT